MTHKSERPIHVALGVWDDVELLDFAGPGEVFAVTESDSGPAFRVFTIGPTGRPVISQGFLTLQPEYTAAEHPPVDVLVLPGGGTEALSEDARFMEWLRETTTKARIVLSVCTGAFLLARLGVLEGLEATTWHGAIDRFAATFPDVQVHRQRRFVDNGQIITSAGVSAGIDAALHVVERLVGEAAAMQTSRYMEYEGRRRLSE